MKSRQKTLYDKSRSQIQTRDITNDRRFQILLCTRHVGDFVRVKFSKVRGGLNDAGMATVLQRTYVRSSDGTFPLGSIVLWGTLVDWASRGNAEIPNKMRHALMHSQSLGCRSNSCPYKTEWQAPSSRFPSLGPTSYRRSLRPDEVFPVIH